MIKLISNDFFIMEKQINKSNKLIETKPELIDKIVSYYLKTNTLIRGNKIIRF